MPSWADLHVRNVQQDFAKQWTKGIIKYLSAVNIFYSSPPKSVPKRRERSEKVNCERSFLEQKSSSQKKTERTLANNAMIPKQAEDLPLFINDRWKRFAINEEGSEHVDLFLLQNISMLSISSYGPWLSRFFFDFCPSIRSPAQIITSSKSHNCSHKKDEIK